MNSSNVITGSAVSNGTKTFSNIPTNTSGYWYVNEVTTPTGFQQIPNGTIRATISDGSTTTTYPGSDNGVTNITASPSITLSDTGNTYVASSTSSGTSTSATINNLRNTKKTIELYKDWTSNFNYLANTLSGEDPLLNPNVFDPIFDVTVVAPGNSNWVATDFVTASQLGQYNTMTNFNRSYNSTDDETTYTFKLRLSYYQSTDLDFSIDVPIESTIEVEEDLTGYPDDMVVMPRIEFVYYTNDIHTTLTEGIADTGPIDAQSVDDIIFCNGAYRAANRSLTVSKNVDGTSNSSEEFEFEVFLVRLDCFDQLGPYNDSSYYSSYFIEPIELETNSSITVSDEERPDNDTYAVELAPSVGTSNVNYYDPLDPFMHQPDPPTKHNIYFSSPDNFGYSRAEIPIVYMNLDDPTDPFNGYFDSYTYGSSLSSMMALRFKLKDGETSKINNLPTGVLAAVKEKGASNYISSFSGKTNGDLPVSGSNTESNEDLWTTTSKVDGSTSPIVHNEVSTESGGTFDEYSIDLPWPAEDPDLEEWVNPHQTLFFERGNTEIEFTNRLEAPAVTHQLYIDKNVKGNLGHREDLFNMTLNIDNATPGAVITATGSTDDVLIETEDTDNPEASSASFTVPNSGTLQIHFMLKDDTHITVSGIPDESGYNFIEWNNDHTPSAQAFNGSYRNENVTINDRGDLYVTGVSMSTDDQIYVTNTRTFRTVTGLNDSMMLLLMLIGIVSTALVATIVVTRKRKKHFEA